MGHTRQYAAIQPAPRFLHGMHGAEKTIDIFGVRIGFQSEQAILDDLQMLSASEQRIRDLGPALRHRAEALYVNDTRVPLLLQSNRWISAASTTFFRVFWFRCDLPARNSCSADARP